MLVPILLRFWSYVCRKIFLFHLSLSRFISKSPDAWTRMRRSARRCGAQESTAQRSADIWMPRQGASPVVVPQRIVVVVVVVVTSHPASPVIRLNASKAVSYHWFVWSLETLDQDMLPAPHVSV
ncbi:hypothetical protein LZ32DRAFT_25689 [Colletotrichum eremochloae]|nr:hypothetical protein LZ32DRAFT_25689 [Colletotrichum eremochloae]